MNKLFTKIAAATLGVALAIGVGVAASHSGVVRETRAADPVTYNFSSIPTTGWKTAGGSQTINSVSWTYSSSTYISNNSSKIQVGSKNSPQTSAWTIQTPVSSFFTNGKKITSVAITGYTTADSATYDIYVGDASVKNGSLTTSSATYTASSLNVTSGNIIVTLTGSSTSKAMYLSNISVTYEDAGTPAISFSPSSLSLRTGQAASTVQATASYIGTDIEYIWGIKTDEDADVVSLSGEETATVSVTPLKAGSTILECYAEGSTGHITGYVNVSVVLSPTSVVVTVGGDPIDSSYVMEQYEGNGKTPTVTVLPEGVSQEYTLTVQSESVSGAFTISNKKINYVKEGTGVIRISSNVDSSVYFDLKVKALANPYTPDSLTYSGTPVTQTHGKAFDDTGLSYSIVRASGSQAIAKANISYSPAAIDFDTTSVVATHADSGQSIEIPVTVTQPITVAEALAIISELPSGGTTSDKYYVRGICSWAQDLEGKTYKTQDYRISDDGADSNTLTIYRGTYVDGGDISYTDGEYFGEGDKVVVYGKLQNYNGTTPEMIGNAPAVKLTIYYKQILQWITDNLHLADYNTNQGYCADSEHHYYLTAKSTLKALNTTCKGAITEFSSNQEADFRAGYNRYVAWAEANHDGAPFDGNDTVVTSTANSVVFANKKQDYVAIIIVVASLSLVALSSFLVLRKKKEQ